MQPADALFFRMKDTELKPGLRPSYRHLEVLETLSVNDVMRAAPISLQDTDSLAHAAEMLAQIRAKASPK